MIEVYLTASRFYGDGYAHTVGQEILVSEQELAGGAHNFNYEGDMNGVLHAEVKFFGVFGEQEGGIGRGNFSLFAGGDQLLNVGGFFTQVPLAVEVYVNSVDCWLAVHASIQRRD
ncbi:hypothetical protein [Arhodomonas sp. AD133]|uniref:hypothetical protein n=1 Tax=Arhodomonas sp. AD133 TaxID=3415009 RepID=UPI003EB8CD7F